MRPTWAAQQEQGNAAEPAAPAHGGAHPPRWRRPSGTVAGAVAGAMFVLWLGALAAGLGALARYKNTPGAAVRPPLRWPGQSGIALDGQRPTLLMFAHPRCACTRASLTELARVLSGQVDRVAAYVLFFQPPDAAADWAQGELMQRAAAIPGLRVRLDPQGREARHFSSTTSGHVLLYGPDGALLFAGGITPSRGHSGDSEGGRALSARIAAAGAAADIRWAGAPPQTATFGCALMGPPSGRGGTDPSPRLNPDHPPTTAPPFPAARGHHVSEHQRR